MMEVRNFMKPYEEYNDKLMIKIDWLSFTIQKFMTPEEVVKYFGMDVEEFKEEARGLNGYRKQYTHRTNGDKGLIRVLYDGQEDMGVHVDVSGSAIHHFFEAFENKLTCDTPFGDKAIQLPENFDFQNKENIVVVLLAYIRRIAKFTRIDVALDDFGPFFTLGEINALVENKQMVTKFRTYKRVIEASISGSDLKGETLYIGSNKSDAFIRIYNKALEQNMADMDWIRWEIQLRDARSEAFVDMLLSDELKPVSFASAAVSLLAGFLRFIELDNANRSRCSTCEKWLEFIASASALRLSVPKKEASIDTKLEWIQKQVAPSLVGLIYAYDGDSEKVIGDFATQFYRNSYEAQRMFKEAYKRLMDINEKDSEENGQCGNGIE